MDVMSVEAEHFQDLVGQEFQTVDGTLRLEAVEQLRGGNGTGSNESFALLLTGPSTLGQGTVQIGHESIGDVAIFIVPIAEDERGRTFESIFNRVAAR